MEASGTEGDTKRRLGRAKFSTTESSGNGTLCQSRDPRKPQKTGPSRVTNEAGEVARLLQGAEVCGFLVSISFETVLRASSR